MTDSMKAALGTLVLWLALAVPAAALDRPWIGDVFFYWYTWDSRQELGWMGGVHNTPLDGYYDSRTLRDNRRSLWRASEWGMTHHFMDYWSPDWKADDGRMREAVVMEAAESLRKDGYDIHMAYYQDGHNFAMREFSRNVSERRDVHQWLRDFAKSPAWPKIDGRPLQLVYGRNGRPETTIDHEGFRRFLADRYKDVAALNAEWGTDFRGFDQIEMAFGARGHQRAASIEYQYEIWRREWARLDGLVKKEFGFPGMKASFDVGYGPFMGFGFGNFARTFGGPHSYGGIFAAPEEQDAQRFIQAAVARKYGSVFFDHLKNYYFDWGIRSPGIAYLPDPHHFDRFWVGALARHSEAVLHMSWNEWWEGSNLEPCREFGKTYCEKNLFYATLMKLCFDSIRNSGRDAPVAVLLNDWRFASGAGGEEELYGTIQILRRLGVPFDLLPDDFVTADELARFRLVIAPTYACGLGYNRDRQPILDVLTDWLKSGDRRLILSDHKSIAAKLALQEKPLAASQPAPQEPAAPDLNLYIDVGAPGDDQLLRSGTSGRETGMRSGDDATFRWTPGAGNETRLVLPASPGRDHVLRIRGVAIWPNTVTVLVNGCEAASVGIGAGPVAVDVAIPAARIGPAPMIALVLRYAQSHVPGKIAPKQYPGEARVCNLAINNLQWSTANVAAGERKPQFKIVEDAVRLAADVFADAKGEEIAVPFRVRPRLAAPGATVLSALRIGGVPRDLSVPFGPSKVLYVNGHLSEIEEVGYWLPVLRKWAGVEFHRYAFCPDDKRPRFVVDRLTAGDTEFILAINHGPPDRLTLSAAHRDEPLSESMVLTRDGATFKPLATAGRREGAHEGTDRVAHYGVYQFAFSPLRIDTPKLALQPGEEKAFEVTVTNLTDANVRGSIEPGAVIPTITGPAIAVDLGPKEKKTVPIKLKAAKTADWGRKTVWLNLVVGVRRAVVLRELEVLKTPEVRAGADFFEDGGIWLRIPRDQSWRTPNLPPGEVVCGEWTGSYPEITPGWPGVWIPYPQAKRPAGGQPALEARKVRILPGLPYVGQPFDREILVPLIPRTFKGPDDAVAALVAFNPSPNAQHDALWGVDLGERKGPFCVRTEDGKPVPSAVVAKGDLRFRVDVPARGARTYYLCTAKPEKLKTDLRCAAKDLGTGRGTLTVENAHYSVTLSEAAGGTVTSLRSKRTGRDYGCKSFGINYGTFHREVAGPRTDTVQHIHESKTCQEDSPGRITVKAENPCHVEAEVRWSDAKVEAVQTYFFGAGMPSLTMHREIKPKDLGNPQELVAFNGRLKVNHLSKTYPNFIGIRNDKEQPHFGWRQGTWVPPYVTFMAPPKFDESVSFVLAAYSRNLTGVRQGFWPAQRPSPGKCEIAQTELLGCKWDESWARISVLIHPGHQLVAKQFQEDQENAIGVIVVDKSEWGK